MKSKFICIGLCLKGSEKKKTIEAIDEKEARNKAILCFGFGRVTTTIEL